SSIVSRGRVGVGFGGIARESPRAPSWELGRSIQYSHQRSVAHLLRMARGPRGPGQRRDRGLSRMRERRTAMARAAIHPGEHLAEELKALGMSAAELARQMRVPTNRVTGILNGQRALTGDTALRLGHFFGTTPEFWLNLQSLYELRRAQQKVGRTVRSLPTLKRQKRRHQAVRA